MPKHVANRVTVEDLDEIEHWAGQLDDLWVIVPRRDAVARTRGVSGYGEKQRMADTLFDLIGEVRRLRVALSFAKSVIHSGEDWSPSCDEMIDGALSADAPAGDSEHA